MVILLTDGSNNMGDISPMTAAQIAKSLGIRVYTIGVGTTGVAPYPMPELVQIYKDIDQLEKTRLNVKKFSKRYEAYQPFAIAAVLIMLIEVLLRLTVFRKI